MGSGDDEAVWTYCDSHFIGRMIRFHDLNRNTTDVKTLEPVHEMTNRQDDKPPCNEITSWKFDNLTSPHKTSPNSNLHYKNAFFPDDSCSNDFFYDEEFAIPFDANLTDQRDSDEGIVPRHHFGIVTSKSDNCLYLGDADHMDSDREASGSEREIFSSSDSSELFNHPLFSSHSECPDEFALEASGDEASVIEDDSPKELRKPNHVKHHYKISFDKGPLKIWSSSDEPASKTSLELRPINKIAHKPNSIGLEKTFNLPWNSNKPSNLARKSKKKSHKSGTAWNSKSSHLVTWGTLKNSSSERSKSRTTWKEMNEKPIVSLHEEEEEEIKNKNPPNDQTSAKSCHEMNFNHLPEKISEKNSQDLQKVGMKSALPSNDKSCELFKIFQDKKLKEVEECMEEFDALQKNDLFCLYECEMVPVRDEGSCSPKCDLQDIFDNSNKSKPEKKFKFKSHSVDPSDTSPVQGSEKSPKIVQSANLASTTSTDSSVQTSLIITIPVKTENKSLQTSLTFAEEKHPETSGRDIWNTSSYLFSRPLPDLSFLKNSSKFLEAKAETTKQHKSLAKEETKTAKKSNSQNQNNKSSFKQTFSKSKALNNSKTSQELSGRSKSSSFSFHSSSSSGIDPGTSDSGRQSSSGSSKDESLQDLNKTPPKPPRLFKVDRPTDNKTKNDIAKEDGRINNSSKIIESSKETNNSKISMESRNTRNAVRGNQHTRRSPSMQDKQEQNIKINSKVVLRSSNNQPTKSILVRSRSKENRRSWSNNLQSGDSSLMPERASPKRRPLSVPDGTLLEPTMPTHEEEKPISENFKAQPETTENVLPPVDPCNAIKPYCKEDGTTANSTGMTATCDLDYEKFRAKKSVSFSETISYHPTTSSLSPLESPKSPVNSVPASPDVEVVQDVSKECSCSDEITQELTEDLELPPNDFLVSPNISPASSLSDSSSLSNLHPLNFDLQQKKDLVMDVMKAVEVILKHISRSKDPLAKAKLCSTMDNPKIGNLLLEHLCPSIHAIVLDGIKPNIPGLFGKIKCSACKVFEESLEGSAYDSLNHLMKSMKDLKFLNNPWLKFNAYLFALLNLKALDMWLASLRKNKPILSRYYNPTSFLQLSSSSTCQTLFLDVIAALHPLSQIQFRLEYDFEVNVVERKRQAFMAEQLLNKHISCSGEVQADTKSYLSRMYNTYSLDSSPPVARASEEKHPTSSLCFDDKKNHEVADENCEPSIFMLWSSVDFGGLAKGFLQKTQNKLMEKLSQSRDMFTLDADNTRNSKRQQNGGSLSESSSQHPQQSLDSFVPPDLPHMTRSECPRSRPDFPGSPCVGTKRAFDSGNPSEISPQNSIPSSNPKKGLPTTSAFQKPQNGLLSSYGNKIIGVFDRLLLNDNSSDVGAFSVRKKYHSEDQISRHMADSPKNETTSKQPFLAKSVSCENDNSPQISRQLTMLASSNSNRLRIARSLCHYVAMNNQFLSFEKDKEMLVVKEIGHDFYLCRLDDQEGLVYKVCMLLTC